jgi:hypothetical protein
MPEPPGPLLCFTCGGTFYAADAKCPECHPTNPKTCGACGKSLESWAVEHGLEFCKLCWEAQKKANRQAFTLQARFLLAKDEAFASQGLTMTVVQQNKLTDHEDVMDCYIVLKRVLEAFKENPNDRNAYKTGMQTLPKLLGLCQHYIKR